MAEVQMHQTRHLPRRRFDAVIVGAGGSGMRCSLQLAEAGMNEEANDKTSKGYEEYRQIIDFAVMRKITYP